MSEFVTQSMPDRPINEIYVWVGVTRDGDEGIISGDYETPFGMRMLPLLSHRRDQAEGYEKAAMAAQTEGAKSGCFFEISLATFIRKPA